MEKYTFWLVSCAFGTLFLGIIARMTWSYLESKGNTPKAGNGFITADSLVAYCKGKHSTGEELLNSRFKVFEVTVASDINDVRKDIKAVHQRLVTGDQRFDRLEVNVDNILNGINKLNGSQQPNGKPNSHIYRSTGR